MSLQNRSTVSKTYVHILIGYNSQSRISNKKNNGSSSIDPLLAAEVVKQYLLPMFKVSQISNIEILSIK